MSEQAVFDALKYRVVVDCHGNRLYYNNAGWLHRTDGPAIECPDNSKYWYQYGHLHRTDGAAVEYDGTKEWWQNGQRHRIDGPAIEQSDGYREWWINGVYSWQNSSMHHTLVHFVQTHTIVLHSAVIIALMQNCSNNLESNLHAGFIILNRNSKS